MDGRVPAKCAGWVPSVDARQMFIRAAAHPEKKILLAQEF
jgi:hypothetical protein